MTKAAHVDRNSVCFICGFGVDGGTGKISGESYQFSKQLSYQFFEYCLCTFDVNKAREMRL
jgi:hypothetical protein